jgi:hypothetical protein
MSVNQKAECTPAMMKFGVIGGVVALIGSFLPLYSVSIKGGGEMLGMLGGLAFNISASTVGGYAWLVPLSALSALLLAVIRMQKGEFDNDRWYMTGVCVAGMILPIVIGINGANAMNNMAGLAQSFAGNSLQAAEGIQSLKEMVSASPSYGLFMVIGGCAVVLASAFKAKTSLPCNLAINTESASE